MTRTAQQLLRLMEPYLEGREPILRILRVAEIRDMIGGYMKFEDKLNLALANSSDDLAHDLCERKGVFRSSVCVKSFAVRVVIFGKQRLLGNKVLTLVFPAWVSKNHVVPGPSHGHFRDIRQ